MTFGETLQVLGLLGGIAAVLTLIWRIIDVRRAYLHIGLTVESLEGSRVKLRTEVKNTNTRPRYLDAAFLVIGPESDAPDATVVALFKPLNEPYDFPRLRDMVRAVTERLKRDKSRIADGSGRMLVPLTYYFEENYDVADEVLACEHIVDCTALPPGTYAARFYIEGIPRLHRVVHASFEVLPTAGR